MAGAANVVILPTEQKRAIGELTKLTPANSLWMNVVPAVERLQKAIGALESKNGHKGTKNTDEMLGFMKFVSRLGDEEVYSLLIALQGKGVELAPLVMSMKNSLNGSSSQQLDTAYVEFTGKLGKASPVSAWDCDGQHDVHLGGPFKAIDSSRFVTKISSNVAQQVSESLTPAAKLSEQGPSAGFDIAVFTAPDHFGFSEPYPALNSG